MRKFPNATSSSGLPPENSPEFFRRWEPGRRRLWAFWLLYFVTWHAAWFGASAFETFGNSISLWYPLAGLLFFVLLTFGWRALPPVLLTQGSLSGVLWMLAPSPVSPSTLLADHLVAPLIKVAAYLLAALALRAWNAGRPHNNFVDQAYTGQFLGAALLASGLTASIGAMWLLYTGPDAFDPWPVAWLHGVIGDFIGIITVAPLLLVHLGPRLRDWLQWGRWRQSSLETPRGRWWLWFACFVGLPLTLVILFKAPSWLGLGVASLPFVTLFVLPPLAWIAIAGGLSVVTVAIFLLETGLAVLATWDGQRNAMLYYQLVMIAVALMGLPLGSMTEAGDSARTRFRDLIRVADDLLWDTNADGLITQLSGKLAWELAPRTGLWWRTGIHAIPRRYRNVLRAALRAKRPFREVLLSIWDHAGEVRWLRVNGLPYQDELGRFAGYRGAATDITTQYVAEQVLADYADQLRREVAAQTAELQRINRDLAFNEQRYRAMLAAAPVGMAEVDAEGCCRYVNFPWCILTGQAATAVLGHSWLDCIRPDQRTEVERRWRMASNLRAGDGEFQSLTDRWLGVYWSALYDHDGATVGAIVILNDITDRRLREQENWELAHYDGLTRLPNRTLFWDRLEQALRLAGRGRQTVAVLGLDLDGFKAVNDNLGHAAGDELLRQVGRRLQATLRESDTAARVGGDEFAVVLTTIARPQDATNVAQKIIDRIGQPFVLPQGPARVSVSIGIALYPDHASTAKELAHRADLAMYAAKQAGKNGWRLWEGGSVTTG
ncbi:MAG: diguanylate cyclase [Candidatus Contendobacter sp.]|nr:diguanylate cyclase [Candidatus Contendobacter sp.]